MQQKPISFTFAAAGSTAVHDVDTADRTGVYDYVLSADVPVTLSWKDEAGTAYGGARLNTNAAPAVIPPLGSGPRFIAKGDLQLVASTSCVATGHVTAEITRANRTLRHASKEERLSWVRG